MPRLEASFLNERCSRVDEDAHRVQSPPALIAFVAQVMHTIVVLPSS